MPLNKKHLAEVALKNGETVITDTPYTTVRNVIRGFTDSQKIIKGKVDPSLKPCFVEMSYLDKDTGKFDKNITINTDNVIFVRKIEAPDVAQSEKKVTKTRAKASKKTTREGEQIAGQTQIGVKDTETNTVSAPEEVENLKRFNI